MRKTVNPDGTADLEGRDLPFDDTEQAWANLTRLAKLAKRSGVPGNLSTLRADLLTRYTAGAYRNATDDEIVDDLRDRATDTDAANTAPANTGPADTGPAGTDAADTSRDPDPLVPPGGPGPAGTDPADTDRVPDLLVPPGGPGPHVPGVPGARASLSTRGRSGSPRPVAGYEIRVKLSTLLRLDDHPGDVPGSGPVHAFLARDIVARQARGHWRYAVTDQHGRLTGDGTIRARPADALSHAPPVTGAVVEIAVPRTLLDELHAHPAKAGPFAPVVADIHRQIHHRTRERTREPDPRRRTPTAGLRRHIEIRDRACIAPACPKPAMNCDIDHALDYAAGGTTTPRNLTPLCRRHHRAKHEAGWILTHLPGEDDGRASEDDGGCGDDGGGVGGGGDGGGGYRWRTSNGLTFHTRPPAIIADLPPPHPRA